MFCDPASKRREDRTPSAAARVRFAVVLGLSIAGLASAADSVADRVVDELQRDRVEAGLGRLDRRAVLDAVALERARAIAAMPHPQRLTFETPIGEQLRASGVMRFDTASAHLDMVRGYKRPERGLLQSWREYRNAWGPVMDPHTTALGAASHRANDGWVVFVAVLVADMRLPDDPRVLEAGIVAAVNELRARNGLPGLVEMPELAALARNHSDDMHRRGFLAHVNPDGDDVGERVSRAGISFAKIGENIHMSRGAKDPVAFAVERWMDSPGHRETILDRSFGRTGAGVAIAEDGSLYFTQLFLAPDRPR